MRGNLESHTTFVKDEENWDEQHQMCAAFKLAHGHLPRRYSPGEYKGLAGWLARQRRIYRNGKLSSDRSEKLKALGVVWHVHEHAFTLMCSALAKHLAQHDIATNGLKGLPKPLKSWRNKIRYKLRHGKLSARQIRLIKAAGLQVVCFSDEHDRNHISAHEQAEVE